MTFLEKFKLEHPDIWEAKTDYEKEHCIIGCPYTHLYEDNAECGASTCAECWAREMPEEEKAKEPVEIKIEEEKKMPNLSSIIRDAVLNAINDSDIEYAVKKAFESYDYSDMIQTAVDDYLDYNIEDIASEVVQEAVRDYMGENL